MLSVCPVQCDVPSAVAIEILALSGANGRVLLRWRTTWESEHAGFNVLRRDAAGGAAGHARWWRLNAALITASAAGATGGRRRTYS